MPWITRPACCPTCRRIRLDESAEYGNSDFDVRNTLTGYVNYNVPTFAGPSRLTKGWEINSGFSFHGGTPYTVISANNPSGNGESADRAVQVHRGSQSCEPLHHQRRGAMVQSQRVCRCSPGHVLPNPPRPELQSRLLGRGCGVHEEHSDGGASQQRSSASTFSTSSTAQTWRRPASRLREKAGTIGSTLGPYLGNPGIGPGEPLNAQFALKIVF